MRENILKYLKTIFLWILIVNFITSLISFASDIDSYLKPTKISRNPTDSILISQAKTIEEELNTVTEDLKNIYGENYPSLGVIYYKAILHYSSVGLVQNFLFSLIAGFGLGNIVYFIFVAQYKKYKLFIALLLALFVTAFFLGLSDIFTYFANNETFQFTISEVLWNMEVTAIPYTIATLVLIVIQKISSTYIEIKNS